MSIFKLIQKFSKHQNVPIEVDDVVAFIRELGIKDEIYFWEVQISGNRLTAAITHWDYPDGQNGVRTVADIYTEQSLTPEEKRAAQVKELLHMLDPEHFRVNTFKDVEALVEKIVLPPDLVDYEKDGDHALSDRMAAYHMMAVLFPWETRKLLIGPFKTGRVTLDQIADLLAVPLPYVQFVMSDEWPSIFDAMMAAEQPRHPDRVHTLKNDLSTIEVHSVPLGTNAYSYAKHLQERDRDPKKIGAFLVETPGQSDILLASQPIEIPGPDK